MVCPTLNDPEEGLLGCRRSLKRFQCPESPAMRSLHGYPGVWMVVKWRGALIQDEDDVGADLPLVPLRRKLGRARRWRLRCEHLEPAVRGVPATSQAAPPAAAAETPAMPIRICRLVTIVAPSQSAATLLVTAD